MRLWHKDLIPYLPRQQLLSQWRECCCIARNIHQNGSPNHILVNKIMDYPDEQFNGYALMICQEMDRRGYRNDIMRFMQYRRSPYFCYRSEIFNDWHNGRYLDQCFYNLQEKYDRGGINEEEWKILEAGYRHCRKEISA